ncbi:carbon-nitrogen hydrolase family protein [Paenibacillus whitsoniae]|uniref:Carbon-nitrogen hydrolase family protein n=1 Tax=Paenibacillus whitsoniae TaxID=2496558 RepID=A0A3S0ICZ8_9BACL|nr:carbon-nitrogen hydrolase family protein [Paenibacillus whitsoniae]RTE10211.1 carbon-nitrogen hydrolase family protein [Paenibacillus whitsoniae]
MNVHRCWQVVFPNGGPTSACAGTRKIHLPLYEAEMGVMPGHDHVVIDTDFGRIGILICHDQEFPESARILALQGAEVIFIPTIGNGLLQTRARARDNGLHVVVAGCGGGANASRVIDPNGELIGYVEDEEMGVCAADLYLDQRLYKYWLSVGPGRGEPRSLYTKERRPETYLDLL